MPEAFPEKSSRKLRHGYAEPAEVVAFHPGPGPDWSPPTAKRKTDSERLAEKERALLDLAVEAWTHSGGQRGELAVQIIGLRAVVGAQAAA